MRHGKKKAAEDARLLANRIALLKLEEKKAWKKIEETKRKAEQVMHIRQRNDQDRRRKDDLRRAREQDEEARLEANLAQRQRTRDAIHAQNQTKALKQAQEAQRLKEQSAKNAEIIAMQREQEYIKNSSIKQMIRQQKYEAESRKDEVSYKRIEYLTNNVLISGKKYEARRAAQQINRQHPRGKQQAHGNRALRRHP
jgi:hypothetical protein